MNAAKCVNCEITKVKKCISKNFVKMEESIKLLVFITKNTWAMPKNLFSFAVRPLRRSAQRENSYSFEEPHLAKVSTVY